MIVFKRNLYAISLFAVSICLAALFVAGCGDEGDTPEDTASPAGVLQPDTTETPVDTPVVEEPVVEEPVVEEEVISFNEHIQPILTESCAIAGCHDAAGAGGLNLSAYDSFKASGTITDGDGEGSTVVRRIDGTLPPQMPPIGGPLDDEQIQLFIDWIDAGAEDN